MSCAFCTYRLLAVLLMTWLKLLTLAFGQAQNAIGLIKFHIISCSSCDAEPFPRRAWKTTNRNWRLGVYNFLTIHERERNRVIWNQTICITHVSDITHVTGNSYCRMFSQSTSEVSDHSGMGQMFSGDFIRFTQNKCQMIHINDYQKTYLSDDSYRWLSWM